MQVIELKAKTVIDALLWLQKKTALNRAKAEELGARLPICDEMLAGTTGKASVKGETNEVRLVAKQGLNVKVDQEKLNDLQNAGKLTKEDIAVFRWKLEVSEDVHKLPHDSAVWQALTITPGTPQLEVTQRG